MIITDEKGNKHYILKNIFNTITQKYEDIEVDLHMYNTFQRKNWKELKKQDNILKNEITFSSLKGSVNGSFDNYHEFASYEYNPEKQFEHKENLRIANIAFKKCLTKVQKERYVLYHVMGLSYQEIADLQGRKKGDIQHSIELAQKKIVNFLLTFD